MNQAISSVQGEYDRRWSSDTYSAVNAGYTPSFIKFMKDGISQAHAAGCEALEVGCGNGFFTSKLLSLGCRVTAVDISEVALMQARKNCPEATFISHNLDLPMPFDDHTFDIVWCSEVLEHLFFPALVLEQMFRILRTNGTLLLTVPYHGLLKNLAIAAFAFERHYDPTYPHIRFYTKRSLRTLVRGVGFDIDEILTCGSQLGIRDFLFPTNILLAAHRPE